MFKSMASALGGISGLVLGQLANPILTERVLTVLGGRGQLFKPLVHHTVSPTILVGSSKINVIPCEVSVELDCRLLPGFKPDDIMREIHHIAGETVELEVVKYDPGPPETDMGLFGTLADILKEGDPDGTPVPLLLGAVTDGRFFARLGIQTYGYTPMCLPEGFNFNQVIHAANERIPVKAVEFGANAIYRALQRFGG
jgi:acetylornithine deacetylase/succinyl-diaminopimelate desuccinylase-like protein